jgi:hypothetical protein
MMRGIGDLPILHRPNYSAVEPEYPRKRESPRWSVPQPDDKEAPLDLAELIAKAVEEFKKKGGRLRTWESEGILFS